jgi:hypothetical protein
MRARIAAFIETHRPRSAPSGGGERCCGKPNDRKRPHEHSVEHALDTVAPGGGLVTTRSGATARRFALQAGAAARRPEHRLRLSARPPFSYGVHPVDPPKIRRLETIATAGWATTALPPSASLCGGPFLRVIPTPATASSHEPLPVAEETPGNVNPQTPTISTNRISRWSCPENHRSSRCQWSVGGACW